MADKILIEYEVELGKIKAQMAELQSQMKETEKAGKDSAKGVTDEFAKTESQAKSLKAQLRELKAQLAVATDPKEIERLARAAGTLTDQIQDATEAARTFASESKFEQIGTAIGGIGQKLLSLDFRGALQQSRLLVSISRSLTFKETLLGLKDLGKTIMNIGSALLTNPLFLIGGAVALIYMNWDKLKSLFSESEKELTKLNDAYEEQKRITAAIVQESDRKVKLLEAEGASLKEIYLERLKGLDAQIAEAKALYRLNSAKLIAAQSNDTLYESYLRINFQLSKAFGLTKAATLAEAALNVEKNKNSKEAIDAQKKAEEDLLNLTNEVNLLRINYDKKTNETIAANAKKLAEYEKVLRDLRTQNIADNYERERQLLENKFSDEIAKYKGQNEIISELEKAKNFELAELNNKYNKVQIQNVDKLISYLNESRTGEVETQMVLKDMSIGLTTEKTKEEIELERQKAEEVKRIQSELFGFSSRLIGDIANIRQNQISSEINMLDEQYSTQKENLKSAFESQLISREEYDKQVADLDKKASEEKAKLQREAFIAQKNASYIQAAISTAQGIANALTVQPATLVPFYLALAAATGAAQLAVIASQPVPKFAKGGEIGGRLHSEGGTLIEAEKGEYVINRKSTMQNKEMLAAINKGLADKYIFENYISPALRHQTKEFENSKNKSFADNIASSMIFNSGQFKDTNIIEALRTNRISEKENFNKLISAIKSGNKNIRDIV